MRRETCVIFVLALMSACASDDVATAPVPTPYGLSARERLTSLEESFEFAADAATVRDRALRTWTVDYDCFSDGSCASAWRSVKASLPDSTLRMYVNAMELFHSRSTMDRRPFQQGLYDFVGFLGGDWYLSSTAGNRIQQWGGMDMLNMSSAGPRHDIAGQSLRYVEYVADYLCSIAWANVGTIDGVELDNMFPYVSWVNGGDIDLDGDGSAEDYWVMDALWREGVRILVARLRSCAPDGFVITGRGHQFVYTDILDGQTVETGTYFADLGVIPGGAFGLVDRMIRLCERTAFSTYNDAPVNDEDATRLYALALMSECHVSLDGGLMGHGHLSQHSYPVLDLDLGRPLAPASYPYELAEDYGPAVITGGTGLMFPVPQRGTWLLALDYEMVGGVYGSSAMSIQYPSAPVETVVQDRWQDGEIYHVFTTGNAATGYISYAGPGQLRIHSWRLLRVDAGTGYFAREFERGTAYYNASDTDRTVTTPAGHRVALEACDGSWCGGYVEYRP